MTDQIALLIERYGYLIVFFGVILGSAGIPITGQIILLASGALLILVPTPMAQETTQRGAALQPKIETIREEKTGVVFQRWFSHRFGAAACYRPARGIRDPSLRSPAPA